MKKLIKPLVLALAVAGSTIPAHAAIECSTVAFAENVTLRKCADDFSDKPDYTIDFGEMTGEGSVLTLYPSQNKNVYMSVHQHRSHHKRNEYVKYQDSNIKVKFDDKIKTLKVRSYTYGTTATIKGFKLEEIKNAKTISIRIDNLHGFTDVKFNVSNYSRMVDAYKKEIAKK